jgi:hypothetical protein
MKTVLTKFMVFGGIILLMLSACKKGDTLVTSNGGKAGALTSSATTLVLQKASLTDTTKVINFNFTQANYGYSAVVTNTLQIDKAGDNWANPTSVTLNNKVLSQGYSTIDFDNILLKQGLIGGTASTVQVRLVQSISSTVTPVYSNVLTLTVTPFNLTSWLYAVGAFQGWNAATADSLLSATSNGIYIGIINFTAGNNQFLILPAKSFTNKYGTNDAPGITSRTVTYNGSNNFYAPAVAGQYIVTLNLNTNTISFALANTYSVIGSSTPGGNFSTDIDLTKYVNDGVTGWTATMALTVGQIKFRQNHDWTYSWGDVTPVDGINATNSNGGNINIATAKSYVVSFNILPSVIGVTPPVTATYSLK